MFAVDHHRAGAVPVKMHNLAAWVGLQRNIDPIGLRQAALHFTFQLQHPRLDLVHFNLQHTVATVQRSPPGKGRAADLGLQGFGVDEKRNARHGNGVGLKRDD